ncbi:MAG: tyrosine--tRNA ligase [Anaerolineaceae bacterium]|nr:tyrosine--tRNA ligase [Anaerolineaceae bacterium]
MDIQKQLEILMSGTEYGDDELKAAMARELGERLVEAEKEKRPLKVYTGYDPRTADLHLGHTVTMRKMRQFQDLGHEVTFLIGDYTALIGDPSDKDKLRPQLTLEQIEQNAITYAEQAFRVLDREKTIVRHNSEWLAKVTFAQLIEMASNFTLQQFILRENFKLRWERNDPIFLHETFYSIMQAYDAYMLKADVQVGGTEQLFSIITAGRKIMTFYGARPNIGILMPILPGTDGVIRMSKSLGNHIPLKATPEDMYGKVMSVPDIAMPAFFRLITRWTPDEIAAIEADLKVEKCHPRDAKMKLAKEIVASLFTDQDAERAEKAFIDLFQNGNIPDEMPEFKLIAGKQVVDILIDAGLCATRSEARRLVEQKGVRLDGNILADAQVPFPGKGVLQVGKRRFVKII